MSSLLGILPSLLARLTTAIFQGYQVFTRGNSVWSIEVVSWGSTVAPWVMIGVLSFVTLGWYVYDYAARKEWSWGIPPLSRIDLYNGAAPQLDKRKKPKGCRWVLENI